MTHEIHNRLAYLHRNHSWRLLDCRKRHRANLRFTDQYQSYDCQQIEAENARLVNRVSQLGGRLMKLPLMTRPSALWELYFSGQRFCTGRHQESRSRIRPYQRRTRCFATSVYSKEMRDAAGKGGKPGSNKGRTSATTCRACGSSC